MGITRIGDEQWFFADAQGGELRIEEAPQAAIRFPDKWRIFGPWGPDENVTTVSFGPQRVEPLHDALVEDLTDIPDELGVGDTVCKGRDVEMVDRTLDFAALFGTHDDRLGHQAYAMAFIELEADATLNLGAGSDWFMQWWVDGKKVLDTCNGGNVAHPFTHTDHGVRREITAGKHLLVARVFSGTGGWLLRAGLPTPEETARAQAARSDRWDFFSQLGEIYPPVHPTLGNYVETMAIRADLRLSDETIECEYQHPIHNGLTGVIFGAQDNGRYYCAYSPSWGQLHRARAFWACIGIAEGNGHIRNLGKMLMPNIPCHFDSWRTFRVERRGDAIQMYVNGVRGPSVKDDTYGAGYIGVTGYSKYQIRNLKINGTPAAGGPWPDEDRRKTPWFLPAPTPPHGELQMANALYRLDKDEILLVLNMSGRRDDGMGAFETFRAQFLLSNDAGRTWSPHGEPFELPEGMSTAVWFQPEPGVIRGPIFADNRMAYRDSTDKGLTWTEPTPCELLGDWAGLLFDEHARNSLINLTQLKDGTVLAVILHVCSPEPGRPIPDFVLGTWGSAGPLIQPYCTISKDQGLSWSQPVPMDDTHMYPNEAQVGPNGDFTETPMAEIPSGRIVALSRPVRSPYAWQTHSDDGGKTWRMACYTTFSGAGYPSLLVTKSGYLVFVARGAGLEMHISTDGGTNWDHGTMIDKPDYFNGATLEVEPDVLLVAYPESQNEIIPSRVRAQRIRITPDGPVPA